MVNSVLNSSMFFSFFFILISSCLRVFALDPESGSGGEFVITLDHSNFTDIVSKNQFIVVEFYAPWCGHCLKLSPEYEKAASILSGNDPPFVLAKVDGSDEGNKELATQFEVNGFPTIKIIRDGGKVVADYKGPRDADGIVSFLKKLSGPPSIEITSSNYASTLLLSNDIFIVGIFPKLTGEEYTNFTILAEKLRSDYEFSHTLDSKLLPHSDISVPGPTIRVFKPFDELFVDFSEFDIEGMEKFIEESSIPLVGLYDKDTSNHKFLVKILESSNDKVMLVLNFGSQEFDSFNLTYRSVAEQYRGKGLGFILGDIEVSNGTLEFFGIKKDEIPLIVIQTNEDMKYFKGKVEPHDISPWIKQYKEGLLTPYIKSEPVPEDNNEPVMVVVSTTLQDVVFGSGKNVLLEFYAPWCGHCQKLAPILEEVALSFEKDDSVIIAKFDATLNDAPKDIFDIKGYPTLYFSSGAGNLTQYEGDRTKEDIINFIEKHREKKPVLPEPSRDEL